MCIKHPWTHTWNVTLHNLYTLSNNFWRQTYIAALVCFIKIHLPFIYIDNGRTIWSTSIINAERTVLQNVHMIGPHNIQLHTHLGIVRCFWLQHSTHPSQMLTFVTHVAYGQSTQKMLISLHDMFKQNTPFQEPHVAALVDFIKNQILGSSSFTLISTS